MCSGGDTKRSNLASRRVHFNQTAKSQTCSLNDTTGAYKVGYIVKNGHFHSCCDALAVHHEAIHQCTV